MNSKTHYSHFCTSFIEDICHGADIVMLHLQLMISISHQSLLTLPNDKHYDAIFGYTILSCHWYGHLNTKLNIISYDLRLCTPLEETPYIYLTM